MRVAEGYRAKTSFVTYHEQELRHHLAMGNIWAIRKILHANSHDPLAQALDRFDDAELESTLKGALA